ncbi:DUF3761 domain-containing protein [Nostocoides sp. HKS02]|uniref:DUF3761 domain-containing protein n=1 Tax=Nostocoides sp. HKS02 TaxID=1813880 RepID=UPI001E3E18E8|nr:DUF3761 domain-containing protein [Tetrasphaera sp. HKS02]
MLGAAGTGLSGAVTAIAMFGFVIGVIGLLRGRVRWAHLRSRTAAAATLAGSLAAFTLAAVAAPAPPTPATTASPAAASRAPARSRPAASASAGTSTAASPSATNPPQPSHVPAAARVIPAAAGDTVNAAGAVLPNAARTPGAVNPAVTQATIRSTICVAGWTATVRPPSSVTTRLKIQQLASGYAYKGDTTTGDYEEDHLISLELGGSPAATANLWPEPYATAEGARVKDRVENTLHTLVCNHTITLATAQHAIATNWWIAYRTYVTAATSPTTPAPPRVPAPAPAPAPVVPGNGATALCNDGTYSYAAHHRGACSHHGGVRVFYT